MIPDIMIIPQGMAPTKKCGAPLWGQGSVAQRWSVFAVYGVLWWDPGGLPPNTCNRKRRGIHTGLAVSALVYINDWGGASGPDPDSKNLPGLDVRL